MNTMNSVDFNGLIPQIMEKEGIKTIGEELKVIDFVGTAFGDNDENSDSDDD